MKELGIIEHYSSPLLLVRKSDSSYRPVIDFRRLNKITVFGVNPMPNSEIIFAKVGQDKFLSKLDFCKGYWQIPMKIEDKERTAFCAPEGLFHFKVMPFGLVNAGASYGRMMRRLLDGLSRVNNYVDDVLVHTETWEEHIVALRVLFVRVRGYGLTVKPSKCCMAFESLDFVGHKIGQGEVKTQDDKVERIRNAPIPITKKQVRSFLGLTGYYRKFVDKYSKIAVPLSDITKAKRPNKVSWTEETNESLKQLKQALCNASILKLPNVDKPFVLRTDALLQCRSRLFEPHRIDACSVKSRHDGYTSV